MIVMPLNNRLCFALCMNLISFSFSLQMAQMEEEIKRAEKQRHATETTNQG